MLTLFAAIDGEQVVQAVLWVVAIGLCFWLLTWLVDYVALKEPFNKVAKVILAVAAVLFLVNVILSLAGHPLVDWD